MNSSVAHQIGDTYRSLVSMFSASSTKSKFESAGTLTAEEFILAGDLLVFKFPTWEWQPAKKGLEKSYLPADKQYLVTRHVPCLSRVHDIDRRSITQSADGWCVADDDEEQSTTNQPSTSTVKVLESYAPALADLDAELAADHSDVVRVAAPIEDRSRSYDLSITWDKYYQTPRLWLFGYSASGQPLTDKEVCEDVLSEYIAKTVTVDPHPCTGLRTVSIHPCQHSAMMLKVVKEWQQRGLAIRPDLSLFVFLKFISGVVPTINYDFTMDIDM